MRARRLRRAEKLPGIVYGGKVAATPIELDHNEIFHALRKEKFPASILEMVLDGKSERVLLRSFPNASVQTTGSAHRFPAYFRR